LLIELAVSNLGSPSQDARRECRDDLAGTDRLAMRYHGLLNSDVSSGGLLQEGVERGTGRHSRGIFMVNACNVVPWL